MSRGWSLDELPEPGPDAPTVLTTFSCGGGSSMGYKRAGCRIVGAVDIDPKMIASYLLNFPGTPSFTGGVGDIEAMTRAGLIDQWRGVDILDGSPPCTTFSTGGKREKVWGVKQHFQEGDTAQVLDQLFFEYLRLVEAIQPRVFIAENVAGMLMGNARGYVKKVVEVGRSYGYDVQVFRLASSLYGAPQLRPRVFFVGRRLDLNLPKMNVPPPMGSLTVREAIGDVGCTCDGEGCKLIGNDLKMWPDMPPGRSGKAHYKYRRNKVAGFSYMKITPDSPSHTIASSGTYYHWSEHRMMCSTELLRLATFPDDYRILPAINSRAYNKKVLYLTGMSVLPFLMEAVARQVRADVLRS